MSKIIIVSGAPCSGKSTYVAEHMGKKDCRFDFDLYGDAICNYQNREDKPEELQSVIFRIRNTLISICREEECGVENCYIIATKPSEKLKELCGKNAEIVEMEATEEECLERLEKDDSRPDKAYEREKIRKYFHGEEQKGMPTPIDKIKFKDSAQCRAMILSQNISGEKKFDTDYYVEGYATKYNTYLLYDEGEYGKVYERFEPGCFDETDMTDIIMQYDHRGRVFARTSNNTLFVRADNIGLFTAADLGKTEGARNLYGDIDAEMVTKMSWRFRVGEYRIERSTESRDITIVHTKVPKIYDVSAVSIPANDATEINARDFIHGVKDEIARREAELDNIRRKINLLIKLGGTK